MRKLIQVFGDSDGEVGLFETQLPQALAECLIKESFAKDITEDEAVAELETQGVCRVFVTELYIGDEE